VGTWYYRPKYAPTGTGCDLSDGTQTTVTVYPLPNITTTGTLAAVTTSGSAQTTTLAYTATIHLPTSYSIDWTGMADQTSTAFTFITGGGSLTGITIPASTAAGTYTGTMTITNANGCAGTQAVSVNVNPLAPTGTSPQTFCSGN
jgi:hypothetical protein